MPEQLQERRGRPVKVDRSIQKNIALPESLVARLDLLLYDTLQERVPVGAYQKFFEARIREFFATQDRKVANERKKERQASKQQGEAAGTGREDGDSEDNSAG